MKNTRTGTAKTSKFSFGEWVLIDGKISGQYIHHSKDNFHTIDTNGMWNDYEFERITKDVRYSN